MDRTLAAELAPLAYGRAILKLFRQHQFSVGKTQLLNNDEIRHLLVNCVTEHMLHSFMYGSKLKFVKIQLYVEKMFFRIF